MCAAEGPEKLRNWRMQDFALRIDGAGPGRCNVLVVQSPLATGARNRGFSYSPERLRQVRLAAEGAWREDRRRSTPGARDLFGPDVPASSMSPREAGEWLFRSLFAGAVRSAFDRSLARIGALEDSGLRIRLEFDLSQAGMAEISALPWELMCLPGSAEYLALQPCTPTVRFLPVPSAITAMPPRSSLNILIVAPNPRGTATLDLRQEAENLSAAWRKHPEVQVELLQPATPNALLRKLATSPVHVLHFMGHAQFDPADGRGRVLFEDEHGDLQPVHGEVLARLLKGPNSLRLLVLNACATARVPSAHGHQPFAGVATAAVRAGIPAVVAMGAPVSDTAALEFSEQFYTVLATGAPVDVATASGRLAVHARLPESLEWAAPVLYMSVLDGRILDTPVPLASAAAAPAAAGPDGSHAGLRARGWPRRALLWSGVLVLAAALLWGTHFVRWGGMTPAGSEILEAADAAGHLGRTATVCGVVVEVKSHDELPSKPTFIELGRAFPEQDLTGVIWGSERGQFSEDLEAELLRRRVCLQGLIQAYNGRPEIILKKSSQLIVPLP